MDQRSSSYFQAVYNGKSPGFMLFNRFTVKGSMDTYNIDGSSSKKKLKDVFVGVFSHKCDGKSLENGDIPEQILALSASKFA